MVAGEIIEGYTCGACAKRVSIEKKLAIKRLPNTLIVHLQRIIFDLDSMRNVKLNDKLEFSEQLNMKEFMLEQVIMDSKAKIQALKRQQSNAA